MAAYCDATQRENMQLELNQKWYIAPLMLCLLPCLLSVMTLVVSVPVALRYCCSYCAPVYVRNPGAASGYNSSVGR